MLWITQLASAHTESEPGRSGSEHVSIMEPDWVLAASMVGKLTFLNCGIGSVGTESDRAMTKITQWLLMGEGSIFRNGLEQDI